MVTKFLLRLTTLEEKVTEPYLGQMGLVLVGRVDLFHCVEYFGLEMKALPNLGEAAPSQLLASQVTLDKCLVFKDQFVVGSFETFAVTLRLKRWLFFFGFGAVARTAFVLAGLPLTWQPA